MWRTFRGKQNNLTALGIKILVPFFGRVGLYKMGGVWAAK